MAPRRFIHVLATLGIILGVSSHADNHTAAHSGGQEDPGPDQTTYFTLDRQKLAIQGHISLMVLSWFIIMPIATMLSLAKSRYTHFVRFGFTATNSIGVILGVSYKNNTPDLYPGSAHSAVGWIATGIAAAQISHLLVDPVTKIFNRVAGLDERTGGYTMPPMRGSFDSLRDSDGPLSRKRSFDMEAADAAMEARDTSPDPRLYQHESGSTSANDTVYGESDCLQPLHHDRSVGASKIFSGPSLTRTRSLIILMYNFMDRTILVVAFVAFCTGIATFGGLFKGKAIFNGIAHWIKGGVFFWLGIFNLGRWCGCFAEIGWAWNTRPRNPKRQFWLSPEFVESSLIFFYGSTNIFLEHLAGWGKAWTARDLEHVAITVLFIGGGLCGILVEYVRVKGLGKKKAVENMQNTPVWSSRTVDERAEHKSAITADEHKSNGISMNPLPALVIFLMGSSMASHEQASMVSTMIHKQWGNLLCAASVVRLLSYMIMYLKPPTSTPSRPPTELLASFCFISGGIIFMASSRDTVEGMVHLGIDVMALYTVVMGFTGMLMAWVIGLLALKGWAYR